MLLRYNYLKGWYLNLSNVTIITDSTCDLTPEIIKEKNIVVLPLYVNFSFASYKDGDGITTDQLYKLVEEHNELPKTAAISVADFIEAFTKYVNDGNEIIYGGISSAMSRTYENALLAAKEVNEEKIHIIDAANLSTGIGLQILKACKYRDEGKSATEIVELMNKNVSLVKSQFAIETMEYLHKGGRCSGIARFFGSLLKIKPIIVVRDGKMSVGKMPHGKMKVALDAMLKMIEDDKDNVDLDNIIITHSKADSYADYLLPKVKEMFKEANVFLTNAGCVISSHCGKGTIGILYMLKK